MSDRRYVITLSCPDRTGIVARIASFLADLGASITEAAYHAEAEAGVFSTRQVVDAASVPCDVDELRSLFAPVAAELGGEHRISDTGTRKRAVLLVTRDQHCLHDLLGRVWTGELPVEITRVIGNHASLEPIVTAHGVPFHHVPFPAAGDPLREQGKVTAFEEIRKLVDADDPDAIVLARFMQILPAHLCEAWAGRAINIHHSFLPSFAGARPYHQAHRRGVKLIGATCHYATADLDAGPIIEQDVTRVDHADTAADMVRRGRDIERLVLARGLRWHLEDRVLVQGNRTVVFH
ncbi:MULTISPECIES: formyltetrahydrofolate deformylase [Pseudonocardia]|uniref:Formyltetrahydrofolate deformylase n=2 Tax=Pseudonocardia TaxID=1847 RepID=A0A1Y2MS96_PSEAH|nr:MULTISPECIES: formyltetrahydrofolate deformylase [Pseudonocardia]OSY38094.1 Formyltetrahydrofolate deformylase [Pseudonocardia autotrophica]TDN75535.1 formyltetrahydrofolate deformylase [Pseudonocardia autotrophica]BBF99505.1 formyltetrahydrofolate deformylase [Pseudonocardia autotrophica]GEC28506.1 formyltetrahydrofolate deformylase [Pseudonocardia saturnea]